MLLNFSEEEYSELIIELLNQYGHREKILPDIKKKDKKER